MLLWRMVLVRLVALLTVGLTAIAVLLGRHAPRTPDARVGATARYQPVYNSSSGRRALHLLDAETGEIERIPLPRTDCIEQAACSPWQDARGRWHIAGRWWSFARDGVPAVGLARVAVPGGEFLDRIELEAWPYGEPCWLPDTSARMLMTQVEGPLCLVSFATPEGPRSPARGVRQPVPLIWRCRPPWPNLIVFREPCCPSDPRLAQRVIVSLALASVEHDDQATPDSRLWWLRLSADCLAIEEAGRLIELGGRDREDAPIAVERFPCISATPDGGLVLAFLTQRRGTPGLELRLAPLAIDPTTGRPRVEAATVRVVAGGRAPMRPAFSRDGRGVYTIPEAGQSALRVERHSVVDTLATGAAPAPVGHRVARVARGRFGRGTGAIDRDPLVARDAPGAATPRGCLPAMVDGQRALPLWTPWHALHEAFSRAWAALALAASWALTASSSALASWK
jgi:hypothetical protein